MSCRHSLALHTCKVCYPVSGTVIPVGPGDSMDGPGAEPPWQEMSNGAQISRLRNISHIVAHNDNDGLMGVYTAIWTGICCSPTYEFVDYETAAHRKMQIKPRTLFIDITPHRSLLDEARGQQAIIIDHHKTQRDIVEYIGGFYSEEFCASMAFFQFVRKASVELALEAGDRKYLEGLMALQILLKCVNTVDLHQTNNAEWGYASDINAGLAMLDKDLVIKIPPAKLLPWLEEIGPASSRALRTRAINDIYDTETVLVDKVRWVVGTNPKSRATILADAVLGESGQAYGGLIALYESIDDGSIRTTCELRCRDPNVDCSVIAKHFGGGGHKGAAGFRFDGNANQTLAALLCTKGLLRPDQ